MTAFTALSIPLLSSTGGTPEVMYFCALFNIALAKTVEVVVPSPASKLVFAAACFIICAPTFSKGSSSSINLATVTPSFVITGLLPALAKITFLPLGPYDDASLSANVLAPFNTFCCKDGPDSYCLLIVAS